MLTKDRAEEDEHWIFWVGWDTWVTKDAIGEDELGVFNGGTIVTFYVYIGFKGRVNFYTERDLEIIDFYFFSASLFFWQLFLNAVNLSYS